MGEKFAPGSKTSARKRKRRGEKVTGGLVKIKKSYEIQHTTRGDIEGFSEVANNTPFRQNCER